MSAECCCSAGIQIFSDWIIPEGMIQRRLGAFYEKNPVMARLIATPVALLSGIIKVFLFPVICVIGIVVMPIIALIRTCQGEKNGRDRMKAWGLCIVGVAASIAFLGVTCYYLPLITSSAILVVIMSISIILHVHKLVKEPVEPPLFRA